METLGPRQKQEWKSNLDDHWIRTGGHDLWDAVFMAFRDYRDASPSSQTEMIRARTGLHPRPSHGWVDVFYQKVVDASASVDNDGFFFNLLPLRMVSSEIIPYTKNFITENTDLEIDQLEEEVMDKCLLLAEYRQQKKNIQKTADEVREEVVGFLTNIFKSIQPFSYDEVQQAMVEIGHQLIIISPQQDILFDSKTWKDGVEGGDYQDVVIVLSHPDGTYDSVGRYSFTKDGHQKISRLFHYDDDVVDALRKKPT